MHRFEKGKRLTINSLSNNLKKLRKEWHNKPKERHKLEQKLMRWKQTYNRINRV